MRECEIKVGDKIKFIHDYPKRWLMATVEKIYDKKTHNMYLCRTRHFNICLRSEEMYHLGVKKEGEKRCRE